ncbi:mechanosensitive ion channel family protein [Thalassobaculum sp.]|uniref:mechanosensitive ion channel family protein n=1 Tax=Thalassobaculum sp. TaxID=2022740 RepID=UPI0032EFD6A9
MIQRIVVALICLLLAAGPVEAQQPVAAAPEEAAHPLRPLDTSSPRATLIGFLNNSDAISRFYRDVYYDQPTFTNLRAIFEARLRTARRVLDLSYIAPATRNQVAVDSSVYLYEILSRIELPPANEIPGPDAVAGTSPPTRWIVPGTNITLVRATEGERQGDYLFSADTVNLAADNYALVHHLPYRRPVPVHDLVANRRLVGGVLIPPKAIETLPGWLKSNVLGLVTWKWLALALLALATTALIVLAQAAAGRLRSIDGERSAVAASLIRLLMPAAIIVLIPIAVVVANGVIHVTEELGSPIRIAAETVVHLVGAWIAWVACVSVAEIIIASPRVAEGTLDAQVLRLCSRILGMVFAMTLILIGGEKIGLPLVGLIAGVGVGGLAIALAAQDTLRNVLGSLMIFFDQPYRAGDQIIVIGVEGVVENIGLRSTRIRQLNGSLTTIPNEKMASVEIVNISKRPGIRRNIRLGLTYETSPEMIDRALTVFREVLHEHAERWADRPPRVFFEDLAPDSLTLVAHTWHHPPDFWAFCATHDRINLRILQRFGEEGIAFAFPTTTTVLEPGSAPIAIEIAGGDKPEVALQT